MIYENISKKYFSCNACRLFFRRAVLNEANYECMLKNSCLKRTQLADIKKCKERFSISRLESFHSIEQVRTSQQWIFRIYAFSISQKINNRTLNEIHSFKLSCSDIKFNSGKIMVSQVESHNQTVE